MYVLGIESSCDETGFAIYHREQGLVANALFSQIKTHQAYGGVVPEIASRDHIRKLIPLLKQVLTEANLSLSDMEAIAYTAGPGLIGALLVGSSFAKSLAYALKIPGIAVHHLEAHLLVAQMESPNIKFPFLALLVSGGHTQIIWAKSLGDYKILGETIDDAAGEAFDKTAKIMGIPYPGGKALSEMACKQAFIDSKLKPFPRPLLDRPDFNFSFSGLKTHCLYAWEKSPKNDASKAAIAYAFQTAAIETLVEKTKRAVLETQIKQLVIAGGVAANDYLRQLVAEKISPHGCEIFFPSLKFCTDNGAMIAYTGAQYLDNHLIDKDLKIQVKARWPLAKT